MFGDPAAPLAVDLPMLAPRLTLLLVAMLLVAGCATMKPPQPWERGTLARPEMRFDADPLDARITQHVYTSKEAASGGYGAGGGGCGCN